jgi:hypothetical protein
MPKHGFPDLDFYAIDMRSSLKIGTKVDPVSVQAELKDVPIKVMNEYYSG